ncbi:hypothetical protein Tco_0695870 [Tanacetum coccineum]
MALLVPLMVMGLESLGTVYEVGTMMKNDRFGVEGKGCRGKSKGIVPQRLSTPLTTPQSRMPSTPPVIPVLSAPPTPRLANHPLGCER